MLKITLLGDPIKDSPWTVKILPGEISAPLSVTNLGAAPITSVAGMTKFFKISTFDIYGNKEISSQTDTVITIIATYVDHLAYPSPLGLPDFTNW